jgi:hypothetical protein
MVPVTANVAEQQTKMRGKQMTNNTRLCLKSNLGAVAALATLLTAACVAPYQPPQQVQASNPSVTYQYHSDQELLQVNQSASTFCNQYHAEPRPATFTNNPDGSKIVAFECVQMAPVVQQAPFNTNLNYTYRTDQELLDASRNAQAYCINRGSPQVISNTAINPDGTRTVAFQCSRA